MIRNYVDYYDNEVPGKGMISYDKRHEDIVIEGFMTNRMKQDRLRSELDKAITYRDNLRLAVKDTSKQIRDLNKQIKRYG